MAEAAPSMAEAAPSMTEAAPSMAEAAPSMAEAAPSMAAAAPSMAEAAPSMAEAAPSMAEAAPSMAEAAPSITENHGQRSTNNKKKDPRKDAIGGGIWTILVGTIAAIFYLAGTIDPTIYGTPLSARVEYSIVLGIILFLLMCDIMMVYGAVKYRPFFLLPMFVTSVLYSGMLFGCWLYNWALTDYDNIRAIDIVVMVISPVGMFFYVVLARDVWVGYTYIRAYNRRVKVVTDIEKEMSYPLIFKEDETGAYELASPPYSETII